MSGITKLGKYLIRRELGKGAMGVVYEGFDPVIERTVAIKMLLPLQQGTAEAADVLARFKREAQAAGRLNHPGIVAVYDYGEAIVEDDNTLLAAPGTTEDTRCPVAFIAMEYVKGRELRDAFEANERFSLPDVARLMSEILAALGHAHTLGVVHRDIKPANLMLLSNGHVKIADFGIARIEKSELTQAGTVMGTPSYMSPEQFMGQTVDARSDLFSCGVILYQFLTGEKPFTGNTTTIMYKVLREEPLAPSMLNLALPDALDAVVKKAIAKNPDQRFQTAAEFAAAIEAAVASPAWEHTMVTRADNTVITARNTSGGADTDVRLAAIPIAPSAAVAAAPGQVRPAKALVGVLAVVALLVASGVYLYLEHGRSASAPLGQTATPPATTATLTTTSQASADTAINPPQEPGNVIVSALGLVDAKDPRFGGDQGAALTEVRADVKRQLIDKVLALYVDTSSLNKNYALIEQKLLSQSGSFIKTVLTEGAPMTGKDGLLGAETRAVVRMREVQKSLNQLSKDERIDFIRQNGDPKVAIQMTVTNADTTQALPPGRSQLAENILKDRIKSFGFRVWSAEGEVKTGPDAKTADFLVQGEARVKQLSARLPASGLTITKTVLTSWTVKAIDRASGEEIYLNTITPKGQSWATEDQALSDIGKLVGDEFSKNFFLQNFNFAVRRIDFNVTGLADAATARLLLREFRAMRQVLDVQMLDEAGKFQLQLPEGNTVALLQDAIIEPLNAKLGQNCFTLAGSSDTALSMSLSGACAGAAVRTKLETAPPAGLLNAPASRGKLLLQGAAPKTVI